jgi:hypothetical protein
VKTDDVPQDDGSCYGDIRRLTYAVDQDGRYQGVPSRGWRAEIDATNVAIELANQRIRESWERVKAGELSALAYHLELARMTPGLLAMDAGVWTWRVKRQLRPKVFARISPALLARFAEALGKAPSALTTIPAQPEAL